MYHISKRGKRNNPRLWTPRVPIICEADGQMDDVPRICLAPTIEQCLLSVGTWARDRVRQVEQPTPGFQLCPEDKYTVWTPVGYPKYFCPTNREVHDVHETDEHWILEPWPMRYLGTIEMSWDYIKGTWLEWRWVQQAERRAA